MATQWVFLYPIAVQVLATASMNGKKTEKEMATEKSLQDMLKERQALEKQIAAKRKAERKAVVDQVRQLCKD